MVAWLVLHPSPKQWGLLTRKIVYWNFREVEFVWIFSANFFLLSQDSPDRVVYFGLKCDLAGVLHTIT